MKIQRKAVLAKFGVCVLIVNLLAATAPGIALAQPPGYNFTHIATLGDSAPGGGKFINDFEPWSINSSGDMAFAADLDTEGEGIFISRKGQISEIMAPANRLLAVGRLTEVFCPTPRSMTRVTLLSPSRSATSRLLVFTILPGLLGRLAP